MIVLFAELITNVLNLKNRLTLILRHPAPYAILSWRYLLPRQSAAVRLHKLFFLHAWPNRPRVVWLVIAVFSYTKWFVFQGWVQLLRVWKKLSPVLQKENGISRNKQFIGLLKLVFLQTTPPVYYYRYRLYRYTTLEWLNFIYTHELPNWHGVMSLGVSPKTTNLLSDKAAFAQEMQKQGLPVIDGIVIRKGSRLTQGQLFQQKSLFLMPLCGNRKIGAYGLEYHSSTDSYSLIISEDATVDSREELLSFFQSQIEKQDYLAQPFLLNHPDLQKLSEYHSLITFRVVTIWAENRVLPISAIAEFPVNDSSGYVYPLPVDLQNGTILALKEKSVTTKREIEPKFEHVPGHRIVHWHELVEIAQKAHAVFPDLFSIGWDLAVTPEGVKLIEGNINWAVAPHQLNGPVLMPAHISYARQDIFENKKNKR